MLNDTQIADLLKSSKKIAVVGLSDKPWRPSLGVTQYMASRGYEIIPVNPEIAESLGKASHASLDDVPGPIDIVNIFRRSEFVGPIVDSAIALRPKCVWMQEGVRDDEAAERARAAGISVIQDRCILNRSPIPTQMVSNGEYMPMAQTRQQKEVEERIKALADDYGKELGLNRRDFLRTGSGTAAAFMAMNKVFGPLFAVDTAEAADPAAAEERRAALADEFIFDVQTHHVRSNFDRAGILNLTAWAQGQNEKGILINPELGRERHTIDRLKFDHYIKDIFLDSDVKIAILSGFTSETPEHMALTTDEIIESRTLVNELTGSQRLMGHGLFWPGKEGNLEEMERIAKDLKIDSWKGYTVGDPNEGGSDYPWLMDDEKVAFPCWEIAEKLGIRNVCIHKGLIPPDYETFTNWEYAGVGDIAGAAKAFPNINFLIYHSALRPMMSLNAAEEEFEKNGYIPWVTDLARLPSEHGVKNVYAEIGTSFASAVVTHPRLAAGMLGQLIEGFGADHVLFGTDSIWYGTPQWQIEALRRLEIPEDLQKKHGFAPLGPATGEVKRALFGLNGARVFGVDLDAQRNPMPADYQDKLARIKADYREMGGKPDNTYYGWVNTG